MLHCVWASGRSVVCCAPPTTPYRYVRIENGLALDDTVLVLVKHHYISLEKIKRAEFCSQTLVVTKVWKTVITDNNDPGGEGDTPPQAGSVVGVKPESVASYVLWGGLKKLPVVIDYVTVIIRVDGQRHVLCPMILCSHAGCDLLMCSSWMTAVKENVERNGMKALIITRTVFISWHYYLSNHTNN